MKTSLSKALVLGLLVALVVALPVLAAPSFGTPQPTYPTSFEGIAPTLVSGNFGGDVPACEKLYGADNVTDNMVSFYVDDEPLPGYNDGYLEVIVSDDGKYVAWETTNANMLAFVMKGGPNHHIYNYANTVLSSDSWLASPLNTGGNIPEISHYAGCYEKIEACYEDETAWAAGTRYVDQGNWAMYVAYDGEEKTVDLIAGQFYDVGDVTFSAPADGFVTITITLQNGAKFQDVAENVKIQDYEFAPSGNPSPGGFDWKGDATGSFFSIEVPENNFYGVHVDVMRVIDCE